MSSTGTYTNEELVTGCKANERKYQEALYRKVFPSMLSMCMRYTKDEEAALDMVNTGMLRVFQKIDQYSFTGSLEGWIRKICYHAMADHFKKHSKYLSFLVFEERDKTDTSSPDEGLHYADILDMLNHLPEKTERVFRMHAIDGYTHKEIGLSLDISEGTSKWHLNSARTKLKEMLSALEKKEKYAG